MIQDPDPVTLPTMVARSPQQQLRGIATDRCYVWPAYEATHLAVRTVLDLQQYGDFWIIREGHEPFSRDWSTHGDDPTRDGLLLLLGRAAEDRRGIRRLLRWFQQSSKGSPPRSGPSGSQ